MKKILLLTMLNCFSFAEVEIKTEYTTAEENWILSDRIKYEIKSSLKDLNYDNESFYLKGTCYINSTGKLIYRLNKESNEGYNNKVLIVQKLNELKEKGFKEDREIINKMDKSYDYKDIIFTFEAEQK